MPSERSSCGRFKAATRRRSLTRLHFAETMSSRGGSRSMRPTDRRWIEYALMQDKQVVSEGDGVGSRV